VSDLRSVGVAALAASVGLCASLHAQTVLPDVTVTANPSAKKKPAQPRPAKPAATSAVTAPPAQQAAAGPSPAAAAATNAAITGTPPVSSRFQLPQLSSSITAKQIEEQINLKDPEDALKYMPDLFVRKRNDGDNQAVLATRTWGLNSSARTLIYADDLLISTLIGNNNSGASPHWNMVSPESIARVDFLAGPYAAAYPGNSIGGVLLITTKMPDKAEGFVKETVSVMPWDQYGTSNTYLTSQTSVSAGNRDGNLAWRITYNHLDSIQQPLTYTTNGSAPANTIGTIPALNKQGVVADVVGTGALQRSIQDTANIKVAYDVLPSVQATYTFGIWNNNQSSNPQTYLSTPAGQPTFGNVSSFASNEYYWEQTHISNAVALRSDTRGVFDFDLSASSYNYLQDTQLNPYTVTPYSSTSQGLGYSQNGKITLNTGTNWQNYDAKAIWRPFGADGPHEISSGIHFDRYYFDNPVYGSSNWTDAGSDNGLLYSTGVGETLTGALWAQDAWKIFPNLKLTVGGRLETWRALDGVNVETVANSAGTAITSTTGVVNQPELSSTNFSPKVSLSYDMNKDWNVTANFGEAYRYPTVTELYQNVTVSGVATIANPNLVPEQDLNGEINLVRKWDDGKARLTVFDEWVNNAIISQTNLVTNPATGAQTPTTTIGNVAAIQMRGVEVAADKNNVFVNGLQLFGSVTWVDSRIMSDPTWAGTNPLTGLPDTVVGNRVPYVPDWRAKLGFTYRPNDDWAWTVAGRYSGKQYSTLDNTDVVSHVYGAFDDYLVFDTKIHYEATKSLSFDFGIDNIFNEQYFLFHPFPGRTYVMAAKYKF
jgi:iron complex outermembrane recepter protein